MTHQEFIDLWERACKSPHRIQSMYFGGPHGFCSQWKIELWSGGNLCAQLILSSCGIFDSTEARKTWRLYPFVTGHAMEEKALTNEQTLRCIDAYDCGKKLASTMPIEELL